MQSSLVELGKSGMALAMDKIFGLLVLVRQTPSMRCRARQSMAMRFESQCLFLAEQNHLFKSFGDLFRLEHCPKR